MDPPALIVSVLLSGRRRLLGPRLLCCDLVRNGWAAPGLKLGISFVELRLFLKRCALDRDLAALAFRSLLELFDRTVGFEAVDLGGERPAARVLLGGSGLRGKRARREIEPGICASAGQGCRDGDDAD